MATILPTPNQAAGWAAGKVQSGWDSITGMLGGSGNNTSKTTGKWVFPLTLQGSHHTSRLVFNATDAIQGNEEGSRRAEIFGGLSKLRLKNIGSVFLYMPELETSYTQNYNEDGRGLLWVLNNAIQNGGGYDNLFGQAGVEGAKAVLGYELDKHAPSLMKDFGRSVRNKHNSANFTGTALRKQAFTFDLRPRNREELVQIAGLIKFFKSNSATSLVSNDYIRVPSRWFIEEVQASGVSNRIIPPFKFGPCFLTNIEIDYTPDGLWKSFENGDPIALKLKLEFMENTIVTREDIQEFNL
jgi:hypothetical protein